MPSPRKASHKARALDQPQDRQGPRPHDPAVAAGAGGSDHRVSDRRRATLRTALGFLQLPPRAPELRLLNQWLDTWTGGGLIAVGLHRQAGPCSSRSTATGSGVRRSTSRASPTPSLAARRGSRRRGWRGRLRAERPWSRASNVSTTGPPEARGGVVTASAGRTGARAVRGRGSPSVHASRSSCGYQLLTKPRRRSSASHIPKQPM
jgi:hypothetical protein